MQYLAVHVGRCNREESCGYHFTPKQYFQENSAQHIFPPLAVTQTKATNSKPASIIPSEIFKQSLCGYNKNNFVTYLISVFDEATVIELINRYKIGSSKLWPGATVFWQLDFHGEIKAGKIMLYDPQNGHRVKTPFSHISWVHAALKIKEYNLQQCFFGEHLLHLYPGLPVAIVESEKTAIVASIYFPQFIWIAAGGKNGCRWTSKEVWKVLMSRKVVLWP